MISFTATVLKFDKQGEKTGWSYLLIPAHIAQEIKPGNRQSFRVKGWLDDHAIKQVSLLPMGEGDFIIPFNAAMRRGTGKREGAPVAVFIEEDSSEIGIPEDLAAALGEDEAATDFFYSQPKSHQHYWIKWLAGVKGAAAREGRIVRAVVALGRGQNFAQMMRAGKAARE